MDGVVLCPFIDFSHMHTDLLLLLSYWRNPLPVVQSFLLVDQITITTFYDSYVLGLVLATLYTPSHLALTMT